MKKYLLVMSLFALCQSSFTDEIDDLFERGENMEYEFERFDERNVFKAISHDAGMMCEEGLCRLTSSHTKWNSFNIELGGNLGNGGTNSNYNYGNNSLGGSGGTIILTDMGNNGGNNGGGNDGNTSDDESNIGWSAHFTMTLNLGTCTRSVHVPRAIFYSINRYMYGLMHEDGTTRRTFTPADEAMILFYSTVLRMASGCGGSGGGGRGR